MTRDQIEERLTDEVMTQAIEVGTGLICPILLSELADMRRVIADALDQPAAPAATGAPDIDPSEFDHTVWADHFTRFVTSNPSAATDVGTIRAWFASAIMAGYYEAVRRHTSLHQPSDQPNPPTE